MDALSAEGSGEIALNWAFQSYCTAKKYGVGLPVRP
jgi:hypothetical protein